ncbi:hypothetical protein N9D31_03395, partial [Oligoflexaceae bacterium]|nr:hypothetical protein [Oligoflexaceae bacterium]
MKSQIKVLLSIFSIFTFANALAAKERRPWLRLNSAAVNIQANLQGTRLAYTHSNSRDLSIVNLSTLKIEKVTPDFVGPSFFWSPDGIRLIFRKHQRSKDLGVHSSILAYDTKLHKSVKISNFPDPTGILTFDPRDNKFLILTRTGIHSNRLEFPGIRQSRWQMATKQVDGRYVASQSA